MTRSLATVAAILALSMGACNNNSTNPSTKPLGGGNTRPPIFISEPAIVVVEAESGAIEAPFESSEEALASGKTCVLLAEKWETHQELHPAFKTKDGGVPVSKEKVSENPAGSALVPNGSVKVPFEIAKAGRYALWARAFFHCSCADSFFFGIDSDMPVDTDGDGKYDENPPEVVAGSTRGRWKWFEFSERKLVLSEGKHELVVYPREDGIKIDQLLFAEIPEPPLEPYVPQGIEQPRE